MVKVLRISERRGENRLRGVRFVKVYFLELVGVFVWGDLFLF